MKADDCGERLPGCSEIGEAGGHLPEVAGNDGGEKSRNARLSLGFDGACDLLLRRVG